MIAAGTGLVTFVDSFRRELIKLRNRTSVSRGAMYSFGAGLTKNSLTTASY
jgi:hypothetical protein